MFIEKEFFEKNIQYIIRRLDKIVYILLLPFVASIIKPERAFYKLLPVIGCRSGIELFSVSTWGVMYYRLNPSVALLPLSQVSPRRTEGSTNAAMPAPADNPAT